MLYTGYTTVGQRQAALCHSCLLPFKLSPVRSEADLGKPLHGVLPHQGALGVVLLDGVVPLPSRPRLATADSQAGPLLSDDGNT